MMPILAIVVYIGCYTDAVHTNGLRAIDLDLKSGAMTHLAEYPADNPVYLARGADGVVYSNWGGGLASFRCDGARVTRLDTIDLGYRAMCHVSASADGGRVNWASYTDGQAGSVAVTNGHFGAVTAHCHRGKGPNLPRQDAAHCHQALPTPDGSGYCVVDLGLDTITTYPRGEVFHTEPAGAGPRHIAFHPNGRLAFCIFELKNLLSAYRWSPTGGFEQADQVGTFAGKPGGATAEGNFGSAVRLAPNTDKVVVSNRGENSLVAFAVDAKTGKLTFASRTFLDGDWPRDFIFVSADIALAMMERSHEVISLRYDAASGAFAPLAKLGGFHRPVCALVSSAAR